MTLVQGILHPFSGHQQIATSHTDLLCDVQLRTISIPQGVVFRVWQRPPGRGRRRIHKLLPPLSSGSQLGTAAWSQEGGKELSSKPLAWEIRSPKEERKHLPLDGGTGLQPTLSQALWNVWSSLHFRNSKIGQSSETLPLEAYTCTHAELE